ncbi:MAG: CDC48 family AAA ATPase [Candidatus Micrarchaeales archaeon]
MAEGIELKVAEALLNDVGRGIARIDSKSRELLNVKSGDYIEIKGKKVSVAMVWPAHQEDEGLNIIRIDGYIRKNAGVSIGEKVFVRKAEPKEATKIVIAPPAEHRLRVSPEFEEYVKRKLEGKALVRGDMLYVSIFSTAFPFVVVQTNPSGVVKVTPQTNIIVKEEPVSEEILKSEVRYEDIGGLKNEIQKIREMVELPLRHPELFERLGIEPPKGVLLYGPPGCGKTLLARAVATESEANFISINGPELVSKYVGESEERLREVFREAEENAPSIIFIDEIDAIAPKREEVTGEVERRMVSQLLTLMDGLKKRGEVIVIAATNRPNAIDPALRRPGRFDREIEIGVPDKNGRKEILQIHTRNMPLAKDVNLDELATITHGFTGADLAALCREAAMLTLRRILPKIDVEQETIPNEILLSIEVKREDFMNALKGIQPSALREVFVEVPNVHWEDIGGLEDVKKELYEIVELPFKKPELFEKIGIRPVKGVLLVGAPGTGKTLLARAVATESEANFISVKGPELLSKYVGESEKALREVFRKAKLAAPCIIFIDEIDGIASIRGRGDETLVNERMVDTFLTEMDGLQTLKNVIVIAATNRPDVLDPALLRQGRFDRVIELPMPDLKARIEIFKVHTRRMPLSKEVNLEELAKQTEGYTGAEIEGICREAGLNAIRNNRKVVTPEDFEEGMKKIKKLVSKNLESKIKEFVQHPETMYR